MKLQRLIDENHFQITRFDNIVERGFANNGIKPEIIASFYSTALVTVPFLYDCRAISFQLDYRLMSRQNSHEIRQIYDEYKKLMSVIDLGKEGKI